MDDIKGNEKAVKNQIAILQREAQQSTPQTGIANHYRKSQTKCTKNLPNSKKGQTGQLAASSYSKKEMLVERILNVLKKRLA